MPVNARAILQKEESYRVAKPGHRPRSSSSMSLLIMLNRVHGAWRSRACCREATSTTSAGRFPQQRSPEGQKEAVADEHTQSPEYSEAQADILEVVVGPAEQVPGLQLFR